MKCSHFAILQLVFVFASCQQYGDLRLDIDDRHDGNGILQIYLQGTWMPVCCEGFNEAAAATACRQKGYTAKPSSFHCYYNDKTKSLQSYVTRCPIQGDYVNYGLSHILRCNGHIQNTSCSQGGVHLHCDGSPLRNEPYNGQVILNTTVYYSYGNLTLYYNNKWLSVCCDGAYFNKSTADSACRQLGYTGASSFDPLNEAAHVSSWNVGKCDKSYSCLKSCFKDPVQIECRPCNVTCVYNTSVEKKYSSGSKAECMIDGPQCMIMNVNDNHLYIALGIFIPLCILLMAVILCFCFKKQLKQLWTKIKKGLCGYEQLNDQRP
jgi:hypothetical protein